MGYFLQICWQINSHNPQTLEAISNTIGYPLELDSKTLLLKVFESQNMSKQTSTDLEASSLIMHVLPEKKELPILPDCEPWQLQWSA